MDQSNPKWLLRGLAAAAVVLSVSACVNPLPKAVTCEKVRALTPGMKEADVEQLIGPPTFAGAKVDGSPERAWHYEQSSWRSIGLLRFAVRFQGDTVREVYSYYEYPWMRNAKDIYVVSAERRFEG